jgi:hypothetical protein
MNAASTLIITIAIGAGAFAWRQQAAVDGLRKETKKAGEELAAQRERRTLLEEELADREEAARLRKNRVASVLNRSSAVAQRTEAMEEQTAALAQEGSTLETEYKALRTAMNTAVEQVRRAAAAAPAVDIPLAGGRVLRESRIRSIANGVISVEHTAGLHRLSMEETPAQWVEDFALTWTLPSAPPAAGIAPVVDESPPAAAPAIASTVPSASTPLVGGNAPATAGDPALDREIQLKREAISSWLQRYASQWNAAEHHSSQASIAALKHLRARYMGRISAHTAVMQDHVTNARKAQSAAQSSLIRINQLRGELDDLLIRRDSGRR